MQNAESSTSPFSILHFAFCILHFLTLALLGTAPSPAAALGRLPLERFSAARGLTNESVTAILNDSRGFLWLGTLDGLSRFDGKRFVHYSTDDGLPDRMVWSIVEDRNGAIWVATSGGVARMSPNAVRGPRLFTPLRASRDVPTGGTTLSIDGEGTVWAACGNDLCRVRDDRLELDTTFRAAGGAGVNGIASSNGELWVSTSGNGAFHRTRDGRWQHLTVYPEAGVDGLGGVLADPRGLLWFSTGYGMVVYNPGGDDHTPLRTRAGAPLTPGQPLRLPPRGGAVVITTITDSPIVCRQPFRARDGAIWQPCYSGLFRIDGANIDYYDGRDGLPLDLTSAAADAEGELWFGTRGDGAFRLVGSGVRTFDREHGLANERIMSIFRLDAATVCATNRAGLSCIRDGALHHASLWPRTMRPSGWGWNQIVARDSAGTLWFASGEGLVHWPRVAAIEDLGRIPPLHVYTTRDGLGLNEIFRVWIDSRGGVWTSTFATHPLSRLDPRSGRFTTFAAFSSSPTAFAEDRAGNIWLGMYEGGLLRYRDGRFESFDDVPEGFVRDLRIDSAGGLWIGTTNGVARIANPTAPLAQLAVTRYSRRDGLSSDSGYCVVELPDGRIGIGSQRGFDVFDPRTRGVVPVTMQDGLPSNEVSVALANDDGSVWLGTIKGLSFLPSVPRRAPSAPPRPRIQSLAIDGIAQPVPELGVPASHVRIEYPRHALAIGFTAPYHDHRHPLRFEYRVGDSAWIPAAADGTLVLDRLPSGHGTIELRSVGASPSPPAVLSFEVIPPLWKRTWFLGAAAALLIALAVLAHRARVAHLVALERIRTKVATDLHDDLGSSLSRISILSEAAKRKTGLNEASPILDEIADSARGLVDALGDTIWSIDPRRDDVRSLLLRARNFAGALFEAQQIAIDVHIPESLATVRLRPEQRRELYLLLKEALTNAARHAAATRVVIDAAVAAHELSITVADDGRGFGEEERERTDGGRGVPSMRDRAQRAGGALRIESAPGGGARVTVVVPLSSRFAA